MLAIKFMNICNDYVNYDEIYKHVFRKPLFEGYSRRTSKYLLIIALIHLTNETSMVDRVRIGVETSRIDRGWSLHINSSIN